MKLNLKPLFRKRPAKKKLMTTVRRVKHRAQTAEYFEEPNIKLSRAFAIVLVLHLVAVGGILAFNNLKTRHGRGSPEIVVENPKPKSAPPVPPAVQPVAPPAKGPVRIYRFRFGDKLADIAAANGVTEKALLELNQLKGSSDVHVGQDLKIPEKSKDAPKKVAETSAAAKGAGATPAPSREKDKDTDAGDTYTVAKSDTVASIAKKLKVSESDLRRVNNITDPRKLQIGQVLEIPSKKPKK